MQIHTEGHMNIVDAERSANEFVDRILSDPDRKDHTFAAMFLSLSASNINALCAVASVCLMRLREQRRGSTDEDTFAA